LGRGLSCLGAPPSHATWRTDPYGGGSTELGLGGRMDVSFKGPQGVGGRRAPRPAAQLVPDAV